jgi:hypothetical protein
MRVTGLVDSPEAMLRPAIALRVLGPRVQTTRSVGRRSDAVGVQPCKRCDDAFGLVAHVHLAVVAT